MTRSGVCNTRFGSKDATPHTGLRVLHILSRYVVRSVITDSTRKTGYSRTYHTWRSILFYVVSDSRARQLTAENLYTDGN